MKTMLNLRSVRSSLLTLTAVLALAPVAAHAETAMKPITEIMEPTGNFPASQFMKVAVVQWAPPDAQIVSTPAEGEAIKARNRELLAATVREAASKGAKMIITSEFGVVGYPDIPGVPPEDMNFTTREQIAPYVETVPGPSTKYFGALAKELGVYIQFGMAENDGETYYNTAVAMGPTGQVLARHRKISLYTLENGFLSPGNSATTFETPAGTIGMTICADIYNETLLDQYRGKVTAVSLSTSWDVMNSGWGQFTQTARSYGVYVLAANQPYFPDSGVAGPKGDTQSHIRQTNGIAYGYLPLKGARR